MPKIASPSQLKQSRIDFSNKKRTGSANAKLTTRASLKRADSEVEIIESQPDSSDDEVEIIEHSFPETPIRVKSKAKAEDSDESTVEPKTSPKKAKASTRKPRASKAKAKAEPLDLDDSEILPETVFPIHAENETPAHQILRVFDLTYKYGPAIGAKRMDRWLRAQKMGLNPPQEVYDILVSHEDDDSYLQNCFYGRL